MSKINKTILNDVAYSLYTNYVVNTNKKSFESGRGYQVMYLSENEFFNIPNQFLNKYTKEANILLRKEKINKIKEKI